jgi:hypothetical protein
MTPETGLFCSNTALTQIKVSITNNGLNSISNIPISVTVSNTSGASGTFAGTYTGTLASLATGEVTLTGTMNVVAGQSYSFATQATLASDQDLRNNQVTFTRTVSTTAAPTAEAIVCDGASTAIIKSASSHQYNGLTNLWEERLSILEEQAHLPCQQEQASCMFRQVKFREVLEQKRNMNIVMVLIMKTLVQRL